ncbi:hypothetical protein LOK49_LG04G02607 [Camellia lanceoleosa]|uniref:Uncharacterized protein n=1 Tax=Camellia lanceoleosa TaxID=1840588 RepID=A0ACC0HYH6_9ERIC|nr:hypothetical protein LOK49_LG04G02607 [Camellia lanceoleosa]
MLQQQQHKNENPYPTAAAPPSSPTGSPAFHHRMANKHRHPSSKRGRPPLPPTSPGTANHHRFVANSPKSEAGQVHLHSQAEFIHTTTQEEPEPSSGSEPSSTDEKETGVDNQQHAARLRLRWFGVLSEAPNGSEEVIAGSGYGTGEEAEEEGEGIVEEVGGDFGAEAAEEVAAAGARRGGHGLEVGPGGLFDEAVADGDLVAGLGRGGGGRGIHGGGGEEVLEGGVGEGFDGDELEIHDRLEGL